MSQSNSIFLAQILEMDGLHFSLIRDQNSATLKRGNDYVAVLWMRMQFLEICENTVLVVPHFAVPNVSPSPKSMNQAPMSATLPSVPVRPNTLTPNPPTTEKPVKTAVPWRQMNFFSKEPVREESQQTRVTVPAHTHTTAGQDRITPAETEQQTGKPCKPYLMRFALEKSGSEKARVLRLPTSRENSERYPKIKQVVNRSLPSNRKGRLRTSSHASNLRGGLKKISAPSDLDRKHVRFQEDTRQTQE